MKGIQKITLNYCASVMHEEDLKYFVLPIHFVYVHIYTHAHIYKKAIINTFAHDN